MVLVCLNSVSREAVGMTIMNAGERKVEAFSCFLQTDLLLFLLIVVTIGNFFGEKRSSHCSSSKAIQGGQDYSIVWL